MIQELPTIVDIKDQPSLRAYRNIIDQKLAQLYDKTEYADRHGTAKRQAFVTLATPNYHWGLLVLIRSIRKVSDVPIIVMMTSPWDFETSEPNVIKVVVPSLAREDTYRGRTEFAATYTKLWVFGLTSFKRVVFLDSDVLVLRPLELLFDGENFLVCRDSVEYAETLRFNSGVMAFTPDHSMFDVIVEKGAQAESSDGGDQGLLNTLFMSKVRFLGTEYNTIRHFWNHNNAEFKSDDVRIIHFIVKKPWEIHYRELPDAVLTDLDDLWTSYLTRDELLGLIRVWRRRQFLAERHVYDATWKPEKLSVFEYLERHRRKFYALAFLLVAGAAGATGYIGYLLAKVP